MLKSIGAWIMAGLAIAALWFKASADRAKARADKRDKEASEAQTEVLTKANESLHKTQKEGRERAEKASSTVDPDFFDNSN